MNTKPLKAWFRMVLFLLTHKTCGEGYMDYGSPHGAICRRPKGHPEGFHHFEPTDRDLGIRKD